MIIFCHSMNIREVKKLFECGKIGQGPDEFITLNAGQATDGNILLYDIMDARH